MNIDGTNWLACTRFISDLARAGDNLSASELADHQGSGPDLHASLRAICGDRTLAQNQDRRARTGAASNRRRSEAKIDGYYECILCFCCTSGCPSHWWNGDRFFGPRGAPAGWRWLTDSRDEAKGRAADNLEDPFRLYRCHNYFELHADLSERTYPGKAIAEIKKKMIERRS